MTLAHILQFGTACDEEPLLGFVLQPTLDFVEVSSSFLPTANTCINSMTLPRPSMNVQIPELPMLFNLYDHAFGSAYFGHR